MSKLYRVDHAGNPQYALEDGGVFRLVEGDVFDGAPYRTGATIRPTSFLAPVTPSKIVAIGLNYKDHAAEMNKPLPPEPLMFMKPSTAVIGPGDSIRLPTGFGSIHYEGELAIVIGRLAHRVPPDRALAHVLGCTCLIDVTARDLQRKDVQYTRAKGFDTFAPIGPCIAIGLDSGDLAIETRINGAVRQSSRTSQLIFAVREIIAFVSAVMTLLPGDVIATGTPAGVGELHSGDRIAVTIEGIGTLENPVIDQEVA
jgi:2-keto-4-pentenoate hydratase/2-oxohepta-3-ene-1,7-dioic acid hydratase in catechol pathway